MKTKKWEYKLEPATEKRFDKEFENVIYPLKDVKIFLAQEINKAREEAKKQGIDEAYKKGYEKGYSNCRKDYNLKTKNIKNKYMDIKKQLKEFLITLNIHNKYLDTCFCDHLAVHRIEELFENQEKETKEKIIKIVEESEGYFLRSSYRDKIVNKIKNEIINKIKNE